MFNNSLENILKSFTKVQLRLDAFATAQEVEAEKQAAAARLAAGRESEARNNVIKARRISGNIDNMLNG